MQSFYMDELNSQISKAKGFETLNDCLSKNLPQSNFDHKVVALFYAAHHYMRALAVKRGVDLGESHKELSKNFNPDLPFSIMPIKRKAWFYYKELRDYSWQARYNDKRNLVESEHLGCTNALLYFKKYIKGCGIPVDG